MVEGLGLNGKPKNTNEQHFEGVLPWKRVVFVHS